MEDFPLSYREIVPDQTLKWREFPINTGGTQSTLQDVKFAEKAGGYSYRNASKYHSRNRFIHWRICHDVLELVEQSLDINLSDGHLKLKFTNTPILDGISIYETYYSMVILVPTVCTVHKLTFPHPDRIHKQDDFVGSHLSVPSIFADVSSSAVQDPSTFFIINNSATSNSTLPHIAASMLTLEEEAMFVLGYPNGEMLLVKQMAHGSFVPMEMKQETIMPKFLSGIAVALRGNKGDGHIPVSIVLHSFGLETFALSLCRDANIRVWSCSKGNCIAISDILSDASESGRQLLQGAQSHILRKSVGCIDSNVMLGVFLSFTNESQFLVLKPSFSGGVFKISRCCMLCSTEQDLVDFSLDTKRLWSVWRDIDGNNSVKSAMFVNNTFSDWMPVVLNPPFEPELVFNESAVDPTEAFVSFIFHPGRFSLSVINKALSIYKRNSNLIDLNVSSAVLKERVCAAVETEIQAEVQEYEITDEDYLDIVNRCWSRFYSCCVQYHAAGTRVLGILLLPSVAGVVLLKKSMFSFLRPMETLEHMMLCSQSTTIECVSSQQEFSQDTAVCNDVIQLMNALVLIDDCLNNEFKTAFEVELSHLRSPEVVISEMLTELLKDIDETEVSSHFSQIHEKISEIRDLYQAMQSLLNALQLGNCSEENSECERGKLFHTISHLFNSKLGVSFVSQCVYQQAQVRFSICRNLYFLQNCLLEKSQSDCNVLESVRSVCMPDTVVFLQAYFVILWLCESVTAHTAPLESSLQRLTPLKLMPVFGLKTSSTPCSLLELFAGSMGSSYAHRHLSKSDLDEDRLPLWHCSFLKYVNIMSQLVWVVSHNLILGEWMLASGQHVLLQRYVRMLNFWCEWNDCSRTFILAASLLNSGEPYKAQDLFLKAGKGIYSDAFLAEKIGLTEGTADADALVHYYLKVVQLFELHGARDCAISVASTTLTLAPEDSPDVATLHSVMFVHHLALGHYREAYDCLNANPDWERRSDNLRDLVKTLLDQRLFDVLLSFPYTGLAGHFVKIIYTRARATDTVDNVFYDFLYAFQVKNSQMRQAASAMYEYAYRLRECHTLEALEKEVKCYLACVNALHLVSSEYAWVLRPADEEDGTVVCIPPTPGTDEKLVKKRLKKLVQVIDLAGVKKELLLATAKLRLARLESNNFSNQPITPDELVAFLSSFGLFKCALQVCETFKVSRNIVFECLTRQCVRLQGSYDPLVWEWLVENDLSDLAVHSSNPSTVCWHLLELFLNNYEKPGATELHKTVCRTVVAVGAFIPHWLMASYKKKNAAELLRLLIRGGRLYEAGDLAVEYINAALGRGKENFGLTNSLVPTAPALCLPVHAIDHLILCFKDHSSSNERCKEEHERLSSAMLKYVTTAQRISGEKVVLPS